jgi:hypothetical protein
MIRDGARITFQVTWYRWRALWLPIGLGIIVALNEITNPWDFLLAATAMKMVALVLVPLYLFIDSRDLNHPWEPLVGGRLGNTVAWWWSDVWSSGASAVITSAGAAAVALIIAFATDGWSWHWGAYTKAQQLQGIGTMIPWHWGLEALALLTLGLWAMGVLVHVLTLWWHSTWLPIVFLLVLNILPITFASSAARVIIWWIPGPQFSLGAHFSSIGTFPALWSFGYAVLLLAGMAGIGAIFVSNYPWEKIPHGTT